MCIWMCDVITSMDVNHLKLNALMIVLCVGVMCDGIWRSMKFFWSNACNGFSQSLSIEFSDFSLTPSIIDVV
jgi:hypothetical protein